MRLLNTQTLQFKEFVGDRIPDYAIASHRWTDEEVSYEDFLAGRGEGSLGFEKIRKLCELSRRLQLPKIADRVRIEGRPGPEDGMCLDWCWIDTCCIDKKSSAELSEAINSMYAWYEKSKICFVFLADVAMNTNSPQHQDNHLYDGYTPFSPAQLSTSAWFTRGWTLQELIAPWTRVFFNRDFKAIGCISRYDYMPTTGPSLLEAVANITGIPPAVLRQEYGAWQDCCIAKRLSWMAHRETAREEDMAYSMLGLFQVNMPLLYGEGAKESFLRLQAQILSKYRDESIFAWSNNFGLRSDFSGLLAWTPAAFADCQNVESAITTSSRLLVVASETPPG